MKTIFIIAEIGINHNGDLNVAKKLIDMAKECGCDAVKFQKRTPEICVPESHKNIPRETPWGTISYLEYRYKVEFNEKDYDDIDQYCKQKNITWFASALDVESQIFLKKYNLEYNKIASAMLTHKPLLKTVAEEKKHTFISTGMSNFKIIDQAVEIFKMYRCPFTLMHCVSTYPADDTECNIQAIKTLRERYKCDIGYSGHEKGLLPSVLAACYGATAIERHITLDRTMFGTDQSASLEKRGLETLVRDVKRIPHILGSGEKEILEREIPIIKKLRYYEN